MSTDEKATSRGGKKWPDYIKKAGNFVGAVTTLVASVATALYIVAPQFQPRNELGVTIDNIAVSHEVLYDSYSSENYGDDGGVQFPSGSPSGIEVMVHAKLMAYQDRHYFMEVSLYEPGTMREVQLPGDAVLEQTCGSKSPEANADAATWVCWHASPEPGTKYFVRATLYDDGTMQRGIFGFGENEYTHEALNFKDSDVFTVPQPIKADTSK